MALKLQKKPSRLFTLHRPSLLPPGAATLFRLGENVCARVLAHADPQITGMICGFRWARFAAASQELLEEGERLQAENNDCSGDDDGSSSSSSSDGFTKATEPGNAPGGALQVLSCTHASWSFSIAGSHPLCPLQSILDAGFSEADAMESLKVTAVLVFYLLVFRRYFECTHSFHPPPPFSFVTTMPSRRLIFCWTHAAATVARAAARNCKMLSLSGWITGIIMTATTDCSLPLSPTPPPPPQRRRRSKLRP